MHFDGRDLSLFVNIVQAGSITGGAEKSNLALAAASARVRNMEASFRTPLLIRSRSGVVPTAAGRTLMQHAAAMLDQARRMHEDLAIYTPGTTGQVRLLSNTNAISEFLPDLLGPFFKTHPAIDVKLEEHVSERIVGLLTEGVADIGILSTDADIAPLQAHGFRHDRYVLIVPAHHALARQESVSFTRLGREDFIAGPSHGLLVQHAERLGLRLRVRVQVATFDAVIRLVASGGGVGVVPRSAALRASQLSPLAIVDVRDRWADRKLQLCVRDVAALSASAKMLFQHLVKSSE